MDKEQSLATELLHMVKQSAQRWFVAFCIMVGVEICTIVGFLWYISLPVDEVTVESDNGGNADYVGNDLEGGINNGGESNTQEKSGTE